MRYPLRDYTTILSVDTVEHQRIWRTPIPTFTPPTYGVKINPETDGGEPERYSLWRYYGTPIQTGYVVLIRSGAATPYPGTISPNYMTQITGNADVPNATANYTAADDGSGEGGLAYFRGGIAYTVTTAEQTILCDAGYGSDEGLSCGV